MGKSAINGKNHGKISYKLGKIMGKSAINGKNHGNISYKWEKSWENQL